MLVVGVIAFNKSKRSLEKESFNKLLAVREVKEDQVEDYFKLINAQVLNYAENQTVVRAMTKLKNGFDSIAIDLKIDSTRMKILDKNLDEYYKKEYLPRLNSNLKDKVTFEEEINNLKNGRILQSLYISLNGNAVGQKCELDDAGDSSKYSRAHKRYHPMFRKFQERFGYYDIFLVDLDGNIIYTCEKEVDYGTNLLTGPLRNSNLATCFRQASVVPGKDSVSFVDFQSFHPSYNLPASFIGAPVYDANKKTGILIFQMPIDEINDIMTNDRNWSEVGLGETGESYIIGEDGLMRNQSRFLIEDSTEYFEMLPQTGTPQHNIEQIKNFHSSVGLQLVNTEGAKDAAKGNEGEKTFTGYRGKPVLSSYGALNVDGMHWAIMSEIDTSEAFENIDELRKELIIALFLLLFVIALFAYLLSKRFSKPIIELTNDAQQLEQGNFDIEIKTQRKDEIGILAASFRKMQSSIKNLVDELRNINQHLEQKVEERTIEIHKQKEVVELQNKEILDSMNYALRLQKAILPSNETLHEALKENFVLFKPKDIVSGDFYWVSSHEHAVLAAAVDCTGHGVPGALVSMIGSNNLNRCIGEFGLRKPSEILDKLKELVVAAFMQHDSEDEVKDGMDIALISLRYIDIPGAAEKTAVLNYSGANNPLWIIRKNAKVPEEGQEEDLLEIKADKQPIGKFDYGKPFTNHEVEVHAGDCIYIFTDGYADQFGGPSGKKFRYKTLKNLLLRIHLLPMEQQKKILDETFESWRGELAQVDDVCVFGIRV
jgi:serine phosphatase RsbU (regulator of sigma subunit)